MSDHYVLGEDGKTPVPAGLMEWAMAFKTNAAGPAPGAGHARVAETSVTPGVRVSTVFMGLDHRYGNGGPPILFETMIFGLPGDEYQERFCTWEEAEAGHAAAVLHAQATLAAGFQDVE